MKKKRQPEGIQLEGQLTAYSAAVRISNSVTTFHRRFGNWPIYAAATGSALAMATGASASILYSGLMNVSVTAPVNGNAIQPLNLDGAGHVFNMRAGAGISSGGSTFGLVDALVANPVKIFDLSTGIQAKRFVAGSLISSLAGSTAAQGVIRAGFTGGNLATNYGAFQVGVAGFAGFMIASTALHPETQYGWIRLEFMNGVNGLPKTLTAIDWAIETNGDAIQVGATPEPGTMGLALLATGAAGILALKRRRKLALAKATV